MRSCLLPIIVLLVLLATSCRQEPEGERTYDLRTSSALLSTGELLLGDENRSESLPDGLLAQLEESRVGRSLAAVLREHWLQREVLLEANRLLAQERYNDLSLLLEKAQREGLATTQLLELAGLPQALQALRLYCARRPYEHASDLEQNLDFLRPWARQLQSLSPAFQYFYQEQQSQLLAMRQQEAVAAEEQVLRRLDWLLSCENQKSRAGDHLAQAAMAYPQLPILKLVQLTSSGAWQATAALHDLLATSGFLPKASKRERLSIELACALAWKSLANSETETLAREWQNLPEAVSLAGTFLRARCLNESSLFEEAIASWQRNASETELAEDAPACLGDYLTCLLDDQATVDSDWARPAPDFASVLHRAASLSK